MNYSVITATLNSEGSLRRTIDSVLLQSPLPCEYIFVDGGSKDKTLDIIASCDFASRGIKLTVERQKEKDGIYGAINQGIKLASGDIIFILHSDDWLEPEAAEAVLAKFANKPDCDIVLSSAFFHSLKKTKFLKNQRNFALFPFLMPIIHPATFVKKTTYDKFALYNAKYRISADYDFFYRCHKAGAQFCEIRKALVNVQLGGYANKHRELARKETLEIGLKHCRLGGFPFFAYLARRLTRR
jgi:glycosyltransferase